MEMGTHNLIIKYILLVASSDNLHNYRLNSVNFALVLIGPFMEGLYMSFPLQKYTNLFKITLAATCYEIYKVL